VAANPRRWTHPFLGESGKIDAILLKTGWWQRQTPTTNN